MNGTVMMRVREDTHRTLREVAEKEGASLQETLARAVEAYRRARFFERMDAAYAALRSDPEAWQQELEERAAWDATLTDGIDNAATRLDPLRRLDAGAKVAGEF